MNDARYFTGENGPNERSSRRNNMVSVPIDKRKFMNEYNSFEFLTNIETRNIDVGDNLFM